MKYTRYFEAMHQRRDRAAIRLEWIQHVIDKPMREVIPRDGRHLRVILLPDGKTAHNAFFDRSFQP